MIPSSLVSSLFLVLIFKREAEEGTSEHHLHPRNDVVFLVLLLVSLVLHVCLPLILRCLIFLSHHHDHCLWFPLSLFLLYLLPSLSFNMI